MFCHRRAAAPPGHQVPRRSGDIEEMAKRQLQMINSLLKLLAPDGRLVYATCSVLKAENSDVVTRFLTEHADVWEDITQRVSAIATDWSGCAPWPAIAPRVSEYRRLLLCCNGASRIE